MANPWRRATRESCAAPSCLAPKAAPFTGGGVKNAPKALARKALVPFWEALIRVGSASVGSRRQQLYICRSDLFSLAM